MNLDKVLVANLSQDGRNLAGMIIIDDGVLHQIDGETTGRTVDPLTLRVYDLMIEHLHLRVSMNTDLHIPHATDLLLWKSDHTMAQVEIEVETDGAVTDHQLKVLLAIVEHQILGTNHPIARNREVDHKLAHRIPDMTQVTLSVHTLHAVPWIEDPRKVDGEHRVQVLPHYLLYHLQCPINSVEGHIYSSVIATYQWTDSPPATSAYVSKSFILRYVFSEVADLGV
jgi:hypothetical protein